MPRWRIKGQEMESGNAVAGQPGMLPAGGLFAWLSRLVSRRVVSLALIALIAITDYAIPWHGLPFVPRAMVDEPSHLATALVVVGAMTRWRGSPLSTSFGWAILASSVLIDADHLPLEFGYSWLTAGTPRPYTHALWLVAVMAMISVAAARWRRRTGTAVPAAVASISAGVACGLSAHFLRDIATAPMSLWWPLSDATFQVAYGWYLGTLLVILAVPLRRPRMRVAVNARYQPDRAFLPG